MILEELEKQMKNMLRRLNDATGDGNNQIFFDLDGWGVIIDGSFGTPGRFGDLDDDIQKYVEGKGD